jgi:hypothetical protein
LRIPKRKLEEEARYAELEEAVRKAEKSMDDFAKGFRDDSVAAQWARQVAADIRKALADIGALDKGGQG